MTANKSTVLYIKFLCTSESWSEFSNSDIHQVFPDHQKYILAL